MKPKRKKILVAIDGSDQSLDAVRYVANMQISQNPKIVLFHVLRRIEQTFWGMGGGPISSRKMAEITAWDAERKKKAQEFMNQALDIMLESGIPGDSVKLKVHKSKVGVARDIAKESLNGYDAIVVGRKGLSKLKDMVLGSVAVKLIEKLGHVPVGVIGGNPRHGKVLLAMDASEGAMRAVDYVGAVVDGSKTHILLFHANRTLHASYPFFPRGVDADDEKELVKGIDAEMSIIFETAKNRLVSAGVNAANIQTQFAAGVNSRAGAIIAEARKGDIGTIVMGRRGLSKVEDFFMGRVTNKVLHMVKNRAVWIVN